MLVYLNGQYLPLEEARVPVEDRGFLFADGLYEVIRVYNGRIFALEPHLRRLADGLRALRIGFTGLDELGPIAERLLDENGLRSGDATIYIQVTRGAAPRAHAFPSPDVPPTVYVAARPFTPYPAAYYENGVKAITVPDTRWTRCDIKTVALIANVLANQQAKEAGAFEALFVRDGVVIEGSHSNLFAVFGDTLVTYPASNYILAGITRSIVLDIAAELGIPVRQGPILADQLFAAGELFLSGTTTEVMPVVQVDGRPIADGRPGPVTQRIQRAFRERI
ncbi:MAG TPA: D-amino-acid transaminase [Longimicrobiales bacterium]